MGPYTWTYALATILALRSLQHFRIASGTRLAFAAKAGNLSVCFLGLSNHRGPEIFRRSAELGMLASVFDLASDTLKYEEAALRQFVRLIDQTVEARVAATLLTLMEQKRSGAFGLDGLERGVGAFRAVLSHLRSDEAWADETEVFSTGIRLQIVDDLLDYKKDLKRGQLNFLQNNRQRGYLEDIIKWDYQRRFHNSVYPLVLFAAVKRAQHVAQISLSGIESKTENLDRVGSF